MSAGRFGGRRRLLPGLALGLALAFPALGAEPLRIGTREAPPFAMRAAGGEWEGISIDLLAEVAAKMGFEYVLVETDLDGMIDKVASGELDGSIAAMTVTAEREQRIDFSHPFYRTGLGAAVARDTTPGLVAILDSLTSAQFLTTVCLLAGLLFVVGGLAWLAERRRNPGQFEPGGRGLFSGFWWAAVTMTTVGYGDKAPVTAMGRLLAIVWMFSALILTAVFTAQLAAGLTSHSINQALTAPVDLGRQRVGFLAGAASEDALRALGARPEPYPSVADGLRAVARGEIRVFVHDAPILIWNAAQIDGVVVSGFTFAPQDYAAVLPQNAPMREAFNQALLSVMDTEAWSAIQRRYLGE